MPSQHQLPLLPLLSSFTDIHTHTPGRPGSILSVPAEGVGVVVDTNRNKPLNERQYYSIQLHPWHLTESSIDTFLRAVEQYRDDPYFVAIGECGLDGLCSTPLDLQLSAFRAALQSARSLGKPVIIHCVKLWSQVIAEAKPYITHSKGTSENTPPLIIHGFRKGPQLARQLLDAGFSISIGAHHHPDILSIIPPHRLYYETDEE